MTLFEGELNGWYKDPDLWRQDLPAALFKKWGTFEPHKLVHDTGGSPLFDEEAEDGAEI